MDISIKLSKIEAMLEQIQASYVEVSKHVDQHPWDYCPADVRCQYQDRKKRINSQRDLHPNERTDRRFIGIVNDPMFVHGLLHSYNIKDTFGFRYR